MKQRLFEKYEQARKNVMDEFKITNIYAAPSIDKIVVNAGVGEMSRSKEFKKQAIEDMAKITGQQPSVRQARVSVASFSVREGMPVGLKVTLRGDRMYSFLDRVISVVLPRLRDFRGVGVKSFDQAGNYTLGFREHTIFPEIDMSKSPKPFGFEMTIVISKSDVKKSKKLLTAMNMPFAKEE